MFFSQLKVTVCSIHVFIYVCYKNHIIHYYHNILIFHGRTMLNLQYLNGYQNFPRERKNDTFNI